MFKVILYTMLVLASFRLSAQKITPDYLVEQLGLPGDSPEYVKLLDKVKKEGGEGDQSSITYKGAVLSVGLFNNTFQEILFQNPSFFPFQLKKGMEKSEAISKLLKSGWEQSSVSSSALYLGDSYKIELGTEQKKSRDYVTAVNVTILDVGIKARHAKIETNFEGINYPGLDILDCYKKYRNSNGFVFLNPETGNCAKGDCLNGDGEMTWPDGSRFTGNFINAYPAKGTFYYHTDRIQDCKCSGTLDRGMPTGLFDIECKGTLKGRIYWDCGVPVRTFDLLINGVAYSGNLFPSLRPASPGKYSFKNGASATITKAWDDDSRDNYGTIDYGNGIKYEGYYDRQTLKKNYKGTMTFDSLHATSVLEFKNDTLLHAEHTVLNYPATGIKQEGNFNLLTGFNDTIITTFENSEHKYKVTGLYKNNHPIGKHALSEEPGNTIIATGVYDSSGKLVTGQDIYSGELSILNLARASKETEAQVLKFADQLKEEIIAQGIKVERTLHIIMKPEDFTAYKVDGIYFSPGKQYNLIIYAPYMKASSYTAKLTKGKQYMGEITFRLRSGSQVLYYGEKALVAPGDKPILTEIGANNGILVFSARGVKGKSDEFYVYICTQ